MPRVRGRPKSKSLPLKGRPALRIIDRKPIRPLERQRMRPWLMELLDNRSCHQLVWISKKEKTFRISWKHAAGQTFDPSADATLFELWARHTGKFYPGDRPDPKKWKANFRCALHSVPDVDEDKSLGVRRGNNAFRVYRFLDEKRVRKSTVKREKDDRCSDEEMDCDFELLRNHGTRSRPKKLDSDEFDSEGSETGYSPSHESNHSDWTLSADDYRRQDHDTEPERSPLPNFEELCQSCPITVYSRVPKKQTRVPKIPTMEDYEAVQSLQYVQATPILPTDNAVADHTYTESEGTEQELVQFLNVGRVEQEVIEETEYMQGFWNSVIDTSLDVQEEIVSAGEDYDGPSVIVLEQVDNSYDYEYTSLDQL